MRRICQEQPEQWTEKLYERFVFRTTHYVERKKENRREEKRRKEKRREEKRSAKKNSINLYDYF